MSKKIIAYEIVDHGVEHEAYFQGCGVAFTKYDEVYTGIGNSLREALEDAAEQAATNGVEIPSKLDDEISLALEREYNEPEHWYYASIRVKLGTSKSEDNNE